MQRPLIHAEKAKCDGPTNIAGNKVACTQLNIVAGKWAINCWLDFQLSSFLPSFETNPKSTNHLINLAAFKNCFRCRSYSLSSPQSHLRIPSRIRQHSREAEKNVCWYKRRIGWFQCLFWWGSFKELLKRLVDASSIPASQKSACHCSNNWCTRCHGKKAHFKEFRPAKFELSLKTLKNAFNWSTWRGAAAKPLGEGPQD